MSAENKNESTSSLLGLITSINTQLTSNFQALKQFKKDHPPNIQLSEQDEETLTSYLLDSTTLLQKLFEQKLNRSLLQQSGGIGKTVNKFSTKLQMEDFNVTTKRCSKRLRRMLNTAKVVRSRLGAIAGCQGAAAETLAAYRHRVKQLNSEGRRKSDMIVYSELRRRQPYNRVAERRYGELPDVPVGLVVEGRGEAAILGIHSSMGSGIDSLKDQSCFAVCMSGKYSDEHELGEDDGIIRYTGSGGLDKKGIQVKDQEENTDNVSLIQSHRTGDPIRLLRRLGGKGSILYRYEGLYKCTDFSYEPSAAGPKVFQFVLEPMPLQSTYCWRQLRNSMR